MASSRLLRLLLLVSCGWTLACSETPARNLVVICIDTLRADHVGSYGYDRDTTPNIDRLAGEGVLFEDVVAQSNWTVPATASILTSLYPSQHGAGLRGPMRHLGTHGPPEPMAKPVETLGQILHRSGMRTALLSANPYLYGRFERGFDLAKVGQRNAATLTDEALDWIAEKPDQGFFLYLQYIDLHQPIDPPEPYFNYFKAGMGGERRDIHKEWGFQTVSDLEERRFRGYRAQKIGLYDGALRFVDAQIGHLREDLEARGLWRDTLVVITSDHGEEFWDHVEIQLELGGDPRNIWGVGHGHTMYNELIRVPWILGGPIASARKRIDCPARQIDIAPTALDYLRMPPESAMQGLSFKPLIDGQRPCREVPQVAESPAYGPDSSAVVWKNHKLIQRADGKRLVYDLRTDKGELKPLEDPPTSLVAGLELMMEEALQAGGGTLPPMGDAEDEDSDNGYDAETEAQLRALGYIN